MAAAISSMPSWIPAVAGVASHWFFFKRGERHLNPLAYVQFLVFSVFTAVVIIRISENDVPTHRIALYALRIAGIYLAGLYGSLVTFRLFLNPLNKFPGPYRARLTAFDIALRLRGSMRRHLYLNELHQKHGKFVRIGPNDLSVTDPDGVQIVHGPNSKCQKAQWYSAESPASSLHTTRDRVDHDRRRRIWSPAFSIKALRGYENRIQRYNDLLLERFEAFSGKD
jgi:tryprostatin B 6-hydroxylase